MRFLSKKEILLREILPPDYIDIHSHLLPGIDDGVQTEYQSAYIIEQFYELGMQKIITTPHIMDQIWPNTSEIIRDKHHEMQQILASLDMNLNFEASAEYMLDDLFLKRIKERDILPLYEQYILVEMSTFNPPINLNELLFEIKLAGYTPILAHPERYSFYFDDFHKLIDLKESGFLFQLNLLSISGYYGDRVKNMSIKLLTEGFYDFSGSDIHNYQQLTILEKGFMPKYANKLTELLKKNDIFS